MASNQYSPFIFKMLLWDTGPYFGSVICSKRNNFRTWFFKINSSKCNVFNNSLSTWNGNQSDTLSSKRARKKYIVLNLYSSRIFSVQRNVVQTLFLQINADTWGKNLGIRARSAQCAGCTHTSNVANRRISLRLFGRSFSLNCKGSSRELRSLPSRIGGSILQCFHDGFPISMWTLMTSCRYHVHD